MEGEKEDSTVQGSKDREMELISRQVSRKGKGIQKKKLSDTLCESNINTVAEGLVSSENITSSSLAADGVGICIASEIHSNITAADDGWRMQSPFSLQTIEQPQVTQEVV